MYLFDLLKKMYNYGQTIGPIARGYSEIRKGLWIEIKFITISIDCHPDSSVQ
jgi:hypothetical protein